MNDFSLHILDLVENSIRAEASVVVVTLAEDASRDALEIGVEDNGQGLSVTPEQAADPFYTTKSGKRTGLGLSLFRAAVESAGGRFSLGSSPLGGAMVKGTMILSHVDRKPLGDVPASLWSLAWANPRVDFRVRVVSRARESMVSLIEVGGAYRAARSDPRVAADFFAEEVRMALTALTSWNDQFAYVGKENH